MFLNKIGLFVESTFWAPSLGRFEGSNTEKTVWGAARTQGVVGSGTRTRFGGVLQTCVSALRREKKGTRFCSETTRVYPMLSISLQFACMGVVVCRTAAIPRIAVSIVTCYVCLVQSITSSNVHKVVWQIHEGIFGLVLSDKLICDHVNLLYDEN